MEIWKEIEGYEGLYQVSNLGNVKSLNKRKGRILKTIKDHFGYLRVRLSKQGELKNHKIHRLVAETFLDNPNNYKQVNHKDENKTNNKVDNLEWCTPKYNCNYGTRNQRITNAQKGKQVLCIETGVIYPSANEVERQLGYNLGNISKCCNGKYKTAYKFHWKYVS